MKIAELKGYKNEPLYKSARKLFDPEKLKADQEVIKRATELAHIESGVAHRDPVARRMLSLGSEIDARARALTAFNRQLKKYGFEKLGQGKSGLAFVHPNYPLACKIFNKDSGYMDFLKYAQSHQSNPHIPKFKGKMLKINEDTFVVRMERLNKIKKTKLFNSLIHELISFSQKDEFEYDLNKNNLPVLAEKFPSILELIKDLFTHFPDSISDLHSNNFLQRDDGTIVLIDPFFNYAV